MGTVVSFIVPTLNEEKNIRDSLRCITELQIPPEIAGIEIIVVDNLSKDRTVEVCREFNAKVISLPPKTISASRNRGAHEAKGDWIAFIDADNQLDARWLFHAAEFLSKPDVVGYGAQAAPPPPGATWVEKYWHIFDQTGTEKKAQEVDWLITTNVIVKKSAFFSVGGFDENLVTCEDSDLGYKLSRKGKLILDAGISTRHARVSTTLTEFFRREAWRGRGNFSGFFKHPFTISELGSLLLPPLFTLCLCMSLIALPISLLLKSSMSSGFLLFLFFPVVFPVLHLLKKRLYLCPFRFWPGLFLLSCVFLFARGLALVYPAPRLN